MKSRLIIGLLLAWIVPIGASAQTLLLLSTGNSTLDTQTQTVLQNGGFTVTVGSQYNSFVAAELAGVDAVLLLPNNNWNSGDMSLVAQTALVAFVQNGGGLVTSEWTNWKVGDGKFQTLEPILPVISTTQWTGGSNITYTRGTPDGMLNAGLPTSFAFIGDSFAGVESLFAPKTGAITYYSSSGGAGGAGVIGWSSGQGRVLQISTTVGPNQLADSNYSRFFQNSVTWVAVPEPSTWLMLLSGLGIILCWARRSRR